MEAKTIIGFDGDPVRKITNPSLEDLVWHWDNFNLKLYNRLAKVKNEKLVLPSKKNKNKGLI